MIGSIGTLAGMRMIEDRHCYTTTTQQFRFPRSKKRRMRDKWRKNQRNWKTIMVPRMYRIGDVFYVHPLLVDRLKKLAVKP